MATDKVEDKGVRGSLMLTQEFEVGVVTRGLNPCLIVHFRAIEVGVTRGVFDAHTGRVRGRLQKSFWRGLFLIGVGHDFYRF